MTTTSAVCSLVLGVFFSCCGWNKMFDPRRAASTRHTMRRYMPWPDYRVWYWFVSASELVLGLMLLVPMIWVWFFGGIMVPFEPMWLVHKISAFGLLVVLASAFWLVGWQQLCDEWQPGNCADWASSILYKTEVLLMIIAALALVM